MADLFDSFSGTAGNELSTRAADSGEAWVAHPSKSAVNGVFSDVGRLRNNDAADFSGNDAVYYNAWTPGTADYDVSAAFFPVSSNNSNPFVWGRMDTSATTGYQLGMEDDGNLFILRKLVAGAATTLQSVAFTPVVNRLYIVTLRMKGTSIRGLLRQSETSIACTAVAATNLLTATASNFKKGEEVRFSGVGGGAGIVAGDVSYYVIASGLTANDFRVSLTPNGTEVDITTNMTAGRVHRFSSGLPGATEQPLDATDSAISAAGKAGISLRNITTDGSGIHFESYRASVPTAFADADYQQIDGWMTTQRELTHPDVWGISGASPGSGGAGTIPTLSSAEKNTVATMVVDPSTGVGVTHLRTCDPTTYNVPTDVNTFNVEDPNDNADPNVINAAGFNFTGPRTLIDFFTRARAVASDVKLGLSPLRMEIAWMGNTTATDVAEWGEWIFALVDAYRDAGVALDFLSMSNEPGGSLNPQSGAFIRDTIKDVAPRFVSGSLSPLLMTPDDIRATAAIGRIDTIMADGTAAAEVDLFASHPYDEDLNNYQQVVDRGVTHSKRVWMTELARGLIGTVNRLSTDMEYVIVMYELLTRYNVSLLGGQQGAHGEQDTNAFVTLNWTNPGVYDGPVFTKWGRFFGQFAKYIRQGSTRIAADTSNASARVFATKNGTRRVIVAINPTAGAITPTITVPQISGISSMSGTRTDTGTDNWASVTAATVTGTTIAPTLAANSVTTFVGDVPSGGPQNNRMMTGVG